MAFKKVKSKSAVPEGPEQLFNDLRTRAYPGMLAHQADVTRKYCADYLDTPDVALQLPTGSGKTLVGLMIGEWRRRKFEERILYVCPTNQLVYQVANEARDKYGLSVDAFTGKKSQYSPDSKRRYKSADSIAVTSYSSLFCTIPFFDDADIIILDDAHSAENYIAAFWNLSISNLDSDCKSLFAAIIAVLKSKIDPGDFRQLTGERNDLWTRGWVDKLPTPVFNEVAVEITDILDTYTKYPSLKKLSYPWSVIRDGIRACQFYIAANEICIRPLIPPTNTHAAFSNAKQRIYMSATLGAGGDLERITGRKEIERIEIPSGWNNQGIGRRFFMFPALEDSESEKLIVSAIKQSGRALVLVPNEKLSSEFGTLVEDKLGEYEVLNARSIEKTKQPFIESSKAVAIVANRYDGIDFPDDSCRLLIAKGLPKATNLQERFIMSRMSAITLLNDRIRTRIIQAIGRCTRSATDYSAVIVLGDELSDYFLSRKRIQYLHPELQAEIKFGKEQSDTRDAEEFLENLSLFLKRGEEWQQVEENILEIREESSQLLLPGTDCLRMAVKHEVKYQYYLWNSDYVNALSECRLVLEKLTDSSLKGYRALWNYLAGSAAYLASETGQEDYKSQARQYFAEAAKGTSAIPWLNQLKSFHSDTASVDDSSDKDLVLIERMESIIDGLGIQNDRKYTTREKQILDGILANAKESFEPAQVLLGELLGYISGNKETSGAPDPWWQVDSDFCFVFEDHSNANSTSSLDVTKARQAASHPNWIRKYLEISDNASIPPILVSPVKKADIDALPHLVGVYYWNLEEYRTWAKKALSVIRELRKTFVEIGDLEWRARALDAYKQNDISPDKLLDKLKQNPAEKVLCEAAKN